MTGGCGQEGITGKEDAGFHGIFSITGKLLLEIFPRKEYTFHTGVSGINRCLVKKHRMALLASHHREILLEKRGWKQGFP
jgi:hypothetical protein